MKKAFTLIELLVVVLIIGVLSAIALPQYTKAVEKSRVAEAKIVLKNMLDASTRYGLETGDCTMDMAEWDITPPGTCTSSGGSIQIRQCTTKNFIYYVDECAYDGNHPNVGTGLKLMADRIGKHYHVDLVGPGYDASTEDEKGAFLCSAGSEYQDEECKTAGAVKRGNLWWF